VHALDGLEFGISSTEIREKLARAERPTELAPAVQEYIESRGLYRRTGSNL
jgi:nicotinic acid mononucleotide adenylyltransferase